MYEMIIFDPYSYPFWVLIITIIAITIAVISRPFSTYIKFVYPNAKFEAMGNPYLEEKNLDSLIESKNLNDLKETINNSKDYNIKGETIEEIQQAINNNFIKTVEMMKNDSSKKMDKFFDTYLKKIDFYFVKQVIKGIIENKEIDQKINDKVLLKETKKLIGELQSTEKENIVEVLKKHGFSDNIISIFSKEQIKQIELDTELDKYILNQLKNVKVPYKCESGKKLFINRLIDIYNIKLVLRAKNIGYEEDTCLKFFLGEGQEIAFWKFKEICGVDNVPQVISSLEGTSYFSPLKDIIEIYNKEKTVQVLEKALDVFVLKIVKDISMQNYVTIGPTIRFLISKEYETKNLRIIAKGIGEKLPVEIIKKYLIKEASF